jgi:hypothetical protein
MKLIQLNKVSRIILLICILSLFSAIFFTYKQTSYQNEAYTSSKKEYRNLTVSIASDLNTLAKEVMNSAESIAASLTNETINLTKEELSDSLKKTLKENTDLYGITIAFKPFAYDQQTKLYSPYWSRKNDKLNFAQIENIYDYSLPKHEWYYTPVHENKRHWTTPFWGGTSDTYLITYSVPFYKNNSPKKPIGTVTAVLSITHLKDFIEAELLGKNGFGGLTTSKGVYLYHPNRDYIISGKTLHEIATEKKDSDRLKVAEQAKLGQRTIIDHISTTTGEESWMVVEPVTSTGWSVQNTFIKRYLRINRDILRQQAIWIIISYVIFSMSISAFLISISSFSRRKTWIFIVINSLLITAGLVQQPVSSTNNFTLVNFENYGFHS